MRPSNKTVISLIMLLIFSAQLVHAQQKEKTKPVVKGRVINQLDEPVVDATVTNLRTGISVITDTKGFFYFKVLAPNTPLKIYGVNIKTDSFFVRRPRDILIRVEEKIVPHVATVDIHQ